MKFAPALKVAVALFGALMFSSAHSDEGSGYWQEVQKKGVLKCGAASAPPYILRDPKTSEYSGIFVDLCRQFGAELGVKVEIVDTNWDNMVAGLQSGRWDMSMALNRTPKRALAVTYSDPVWSFQISAVYDRANPKFANAPQSLQDIDKADVTVAVVSGTAIDAAASPKLKQAQVMRLPDVDAARLAISSRRADVLIEDADTNAILAATNKDRWSVLLPNPPIAKQGIAFAVRRDAKLSDMQVLDIFVQNKLATGEIDELGKGYIDKLSKQN
ncbi:substrate-binding periplasmic protein [Pseudomonas alloputida]|uniref:substrate-binding periplasmic protein n=1 Tax=Pseudomonas TaxID=286 RepID=UPI000EB24460|nr:transporter substrate-binding domain-containing protein [Pseudomonas inefficax]WNN41332.1 transporter substrate-binding domain-containing protein [Pseudomonas inefficax]